MFPADSSTPGAIDLGAVEYLDRALAGIYRNRRETYRLGLKALDDVAQGRHEAIFADLCSSDQDQLLLELEAGTLENFQAPTQIGFFELLRVHLLEGLFSDPLHGGNRDKQGWKFLRHPGVWLDFSEAESLSEEPADKGGETRSLADHEAIYPPEAQAPRPPRFDPQRSIRPSSEPVDVLIVGLGAMGGMVAPIF